MTPSSPVTTGDSMDAETHRDAHPDFATAGAAADYLMERYGFAATPTTTADLRAALEEFMHERNAEPHLLAPAEERLMKVARDWLATTQGAAYEDASPEKDR